MAKAITNPGLKQRVTVQDVYDPEDDYDVPHSGTVDSSGKPKYDELPIRGGHIIAANGEHVNSFGKEIDEDTGEVLDPSRYENEIKSDF